MIRRPPRAKPTYTLCPDATLFRGGRKDGSRACAACSRCQGPRKKQRRRGINGGRADLLGRGRAQVPRKLQGGSGPPPSAGRFEQGEPAGRLRSEETTSELQSLLRSSYAVFSCKQINNMHVHP